MATVTGYTAAHMQAIEDGTIVSGAIVSGHLILSKHDGSTIDVGNVASPAAGGLAGAVLGKVTDSDYDSSWLQNLNLISVFLKVAASNTTAFKVGVTGETYERVQLRPDRLSIAAGDRAPFDGTHTPGAVGIGSDNQIYIEGLTTVANLVHIQAARPGTIPRNQPPLASTPTFPMTAGSVTVTDASEIPSTDAGPQALGKGYLVAPGFSDSFTRTDSASTLGSPWVAQGGSTWGVLDQKAYNVAGGTVSQALYNTGSSRHRMKVTLSGTNADWNNCGIIISYVDASNYIYIVYNSSLVTWNVRKVVAGVDSFMFNAGSLVNAAITIQAEYKDSIVLVLFGDQAARTSIQTFTAGSYCGFMAPAGGAGSSCRWDDFSVESEFVATWSGKSGNTLTGFTCTGASGTAGSTWAVRYKDGSKPILTRWSDPYGAPIAFMFGYGGLHVTDDISMGISLTQDVGMVFGSTRNRTDPGLVLFGDPPISGTGDDSRKGLYLRRISPISGLSVGIAALGGRLLIRPSDLTNSSYVGSAGTAAHPHLSIGEDGNGFFFTAPGIGVGVAGTDLWRILTTGLVPVTTNTVDVGSPTKGLKNLYLQGLMGFMDGSGTPVTLNLGEITGTPEGVVTANPGSLRFDTAGFLWFKASGSGNTGWICVGFNVFNRQTASYTLAITDVGRFIEMNVAGANTLTVPLNATVAFPIGTKIEGSQYGAGVTTITPATGAVNLRSRGSLLNSNGQYSRWKLEKVGTDEWYVSGDLA